MAKKSSPLKPYLKWAGGKRQLLAEIRRYYPAQETEYTYYEPFAGAGAVLFDLRPQRAVINDFNTQLILTYRVVRDQVDALVEALRAHAAHSSREYYYQVRAQDRDPAVFGALGDVEKAARLIYLNKTCYNGLYRVNSQGLFNVPYGKYKNPAICEEDVLRAAHEYLRAGDIDIRSGDFAEAAGGAGAGDFVYFDPPYHSPDNANFTGYQAPGFGEGEQIRLRDTFARLTDAGARCLLSNADTAFIRDIFTDPRFVIETVRAKRPINSKAAGRGDVNEVLIRNWE